MALNLVALMGRLTADPELKTTTSGVSVVRFTIAVDRKYTPQGEERQADFINCVAWRNSAEFISKYFRKGSMIGIEGSVQTSKYQDRDGNPRTAFEILIDHVSFCGSKSESGSANRPPDSQPQFANTTEDFSDLGTDYDGDLPF